MTQMKKAWRFLSSMKFAVLLLVILAAACAGGSFITQNQTYEWYAMQYSERTAAAIKLFGLDDVFHSPWFVILAAFLCLNLLLCNILRLPALRRRYREEFSALRWVGTTGKVSGILGETAGAAGQKNGQEPDEASLKSTVRTIFESMGFRAHIREGIREIRNEDENSGSGDGQDDSRRKTREQKYTYAVRNRIGIWGAWICHLGILILIIGFGLGQIAKKEYTVYGVSGQSKQIGDTDYILSIDDFRIDMREDDTVEQYTADLTVRSASSPESRSASVSVNHPASLFGMKFFQNSGDYIEVSDKPGLVILFSAFYPDYYQENGQSPVSLSSQMNNPGYLYRAYYMNQMIGMNVLTGSDVITIDEYTVIFSDPQNYTLIQVKKDPFTFLALIGGLVVLAGLILAFYLQPKQLWAVSDGDGTVTVTGRSVKGGALFEEQLKEALHTAGARICDGPDGDMAG